MTFTNFLMDKAEEPTIVNQVAPRLQFKEGTILSRTVIHY